MRDLVSDSLIDDLDETGEDAVFHQVLMFIGSARDLVGADWSGVSHFLWKTKKKALPARRGVVRKKKFLFMLKNKLVR